MTVTIELTPEEAEKARFQAEMRGIGVEEYFRQMIPHQSWREQSLQESLTPEEWLKVSHDWLESLPTNLPVLTDEDMSRESIYGDSH